MSSRARRFGETERPFTVNPIRGVRAWVVDQAGDDTPRLALCALTARRHPWQPGENVAACLPPWPLLYDNPDGRTHTVAGKGCECGFYAYLDPANRHVSRRVGNVLGVVEGYGAVSVGAFGFRASRARVVALVEPEHCTTPGCVCQSNAVSAYRASVSALLTSYRVPVYATLEEALERHPLSKPEDYGVEPPTADELANRGGVLVNGGAASAAILSASAGFKRTATAAALVSRQVADLASIMQLTPTQVDAGVARLFAALNQDATKVVSPRAPRDTYAKRFARGGGVIQGPPLTRSTVDEVTGPPNAVALKRERAEQHAAARRSAGLRGAGGFDRKGRRR